MLRDPLDPGHFRSATKMWLTTTARLGSGRRCFALSIAPMVPSPLYRWGTTWHSGLRVGGYPRRSSRPSYEHSSSLFLPPGAPISRPCRPLRMIARRSVHLSRKIAKPVGTRRRRRRATSPWRHCSPRFSLGSGSRVASTRSGRAGVRSATPMYRPTPPLRRGAAEHSIRDGPDFWRRPAEGPHCSTNVVLRACIEDCHLLCRATCLTDMSRDIPDSHANSCRGPPRGRPEGW